MPDNIDPSDLDLLRREEWREAARFARSTLDAYNRNQQTHSGGAAVADLHVGKDGPLIDSAEDLRGWSKRCDSTFEDGRKRCGLDAGHDGSHVHFHDGQGQTSWTEIESDKCLADLQAPADSLSEQERQAMRASIDLGCWEEEVRRDHEGTREEAFVAGLAYARKEGEEDVKRALECQIYAEERAEQAEAENARLRERIGELEEALQAVKRNDKTVYKYAGERSLNRHGQAHPNGDLGTRWSTPREIAIDALAVSSSVSEGDEKFETARECDLDCRVCGAGGGERCKSVFSGYPKPCGRDAELDASASEGDRDKTCGHCGGNGCRFCDHQGHVPETEDKKDPYHAADAEGKPLCGDPDHRHSGPCSVYAKGREPSVSKEQPEAPDEFEISWDGWAYRVSVPNLLQPGERLRVVPAERVPVSQVQRAEELGAREWTIRTDGFGWRVVSGPWGNEPHAPETIIVVPKSRVPVSQEITEAELKVLLMVAGQRVRDEPENTFRIVLREIEGKLRAALGQKEER